MWWGDIQQKYFGLICEGRCGELEAEGGGGEGGWSPIFLKDSKSTSGVYRHFIGGVDGGGPFLESFQ